MSSAKAGSQGGKRADLEGRYFRSQWEANWARYLNWLQAHGQIERWEYEVDEFEFPVKRGSRFYKPDFKVYEHGEVVYHEVKGYMDRESATKLARMGRYYPQVRIIVVGKVAYADVARKVGGMIEGWERGQR